MRGRPSARFGDQALVQLAQPALRPEPARIELGERRGSNLTDEGVANQILDTGLLPRDLHAEGRAEALRRAHRALVVALDLGKHRSVADPRELSARTLEHYERNAEDFRAGTWSHDVRQNVDALLRHVEGQGPFTILDLGCGPGRDLITFSALGHVAVGLDGAAAFARMAREQSGCEVLQQDFLALDLPAQRFDGIFANASLFHVPSRELPGVLENLRLALRPRGVLFSSNPRGNGEEGWSGGRYGCYHELAGWRRILVEAGFEELEHYYRPAGQPRDKQPWLATVWRRLR